MMNVKRSTPAFTPAQQQSSVRGDGKQTLSATERDSMLGDENIGDYLNKVADPNYVDPQKTRRVGNPDLDKDAFLKLFLAQLKNQDPTNPMQNHELAAQLAQFSSLEKLSNIDTGISNLAKQQDPNKSYDALALIGRGVSGDSSKVLRSDKTSKHEITFNLGAPASEVTLSVKNAAGQEVKKLVARNLKAGANKVQWDGMIEAGSTAPEGEYNVDIQAKNNANQKIAAETKFQGKVTGVNFTAEGPVLMIGQQSIRLKDVKRIFDGNDIKEEAKLVDSKAIVGKDAHSLVNPAAMAGNLENVGMSQDLINKLEKEVNKQNNQANDQEDGQRLRGPSKPETKESAQTASSSSSARSAGPKLKI
jgi:flagellar basal-body rod modification protein FlgD